MSPPPAPPPGGPRPAAARPAVVQRIVLRPKTGGDPLKFDYNPSSVSVSGSARWDRPATKGDAPGEFVSTEPRTFSLTARLDARADPREGVAVKVERLFSWLRPTAQSVAKKAPAAPVLAMTWGTQKWFDVVLLSVTANYTVFDPDGKPSRAEVELGLEEYATVVARQNPTSGGPPGRRARLLVAGDTLQSVATEEYGDPTRWRAIAVANGIDDPLAVRPGLEVLLPAADGDAP